MPNAYTGISLGHRIIMVYTAAYHALGLCGWGVDYRSTVESDHSKGR